MQNRRERGGEPETDGERDGERERRIYRAQAIFTYRTSSRPICIVLKLAVPLSDEVCRLEQPLVMVKSAFFSTLELLVNTISQVFLSQVVSCLIHYPIIETFKDLDAKWLFQLPYMLYLVP